MRAFLPVLLLVGCVEYDIQDPDATPPAVPNPRDLDAEMHEDRFEQVSPQTTDILWVLDSSCSMIDENEALAEWFPIFMEHFEDVDTDWHMGVVTTDMGGWSLEDGGTGGLLNNVGDIRWIDRDTPDPVAVFAEMTDVYNAMSWSAGSEKGREAAYTALEIKRLHDANRGFFRAFGDSWLHITVVSDEDDSSTRDPIGKSDFVDWINDIKPIQHRTTFNSIVTLDPRNDEESRGDKYIDLTEQIGGEVFDLHEGDWADILDTLGGLQSPEPIVEWFLSYPPVPDTLEVLVEHGTVTFAFQRDEDWTYDPVRNSVSFIEFQPPDGAIVYLRYVKASSPEAVE